jgi:hypothetical protein
VELVRTIDGSWYGLSVEVGTEGMEVGSSELLLESLESRVQSPESRVQSPEPYRDDDTAGGGAMNGRTSVFRM